ncbi:hypothetical protein GH733_011435 [Mirounga leonina]|nr:hypothetical protein GH733_011435 [Mirounga leonina]
MASKIGLVECIIQFSVGHHEGAEAFNSKILEDIYPELSMAIFRLYSSKSQIHGQRVPYSLAIQEVHERPQHTICILSHRGPGVGGRVPWAPHLAQDVSHLSNTLINPHLKTTHAPTVQPSLPRQTLSLEQRQLFSPTPAYSWSAPAGTANRRRGKIHTPAAGWRVPPHSLGLPVLSNFGLLTSDGNFGRPFGGAIQYTLLHCFHLLHMGNFAHSKDISDNLKDLWLIPLSDLHAAILERPCCPCSTPLTTGALTLQAVGVEQVLALLMALDSTLTAAHALPGNAPEQTFTFIAVGRGSGRPDLKVVRKSIQIQNGVLTGAVHMGFLGHFPPTHLGHCFLPATSHRAPALLTRSWRTHPLSQNAHAHTNLASKLTHTPLKIKAMYPDHEVTWADDSYRGLPKDPAVSHGQALEINTSLAQAPRFTSPTGIKNALRAAVAELRAGAVVAVPTDTLYGLACSASCSAALGAVNRLKGRSEAKPLAVCLGRVADVYGYCHVRVPEGLLKDLLPGPVTLVLERSEELNKDLNPFTPLVGIRIPDHAFIQDLVQVFGGPVALTSANLSSQASSLNGEEFQDLWPQLSLVIDGGPTGDGQSPEYRLGSTVVDLSVPGKFDIIRPGRALESTAAILQQKYRLLAPLALILLLHLRKRGGPEDWCWTLCVCPLGTGKASLTEATGAATSLV